MSEMTTKPQAHPWFVWESEYLEGCTIIAATSAEAAQEEYRRMSGVDPETPLDAKPVTAEDVVRLETELEQAKEENARLREQVQPARRAALEEAAGKLDADCGERNQRIPHGGRVRRGRYRGYSKCYRCPYRGGGESGMSNHTPGPWKAVWNDDEGRIEIHMASALKCSRYCATSHVWMCEATVYSDEDTAHAREIEATANLIAAAPQLLEALEEAEKDLVACRINIRRDLVQRGNTMWEGVPEILDARIKHIRAALAAAKGDGR